ncbi:hypothetical protein Ancab_006405 [Ancistrocladus abbreviatus]
MESLKTGLSEAACQASYPIATISLTWVVKWLNLQDALPYSKGLGFLALSSLSQWTQPMSNTPPTQSCPTSLEGPGQRSSSTSSEKSTLIWTLASEVKFHFKEAQDMPKIQEEFGSKSPNLHQSIIQKHPRKTQTRQNPRQSGERVGPVLDIAKKQDDQGIIDLQDFFQHYMYDLTHWLVISYDPNSLSVEWPEVLVSKALNVAMEAVFYHYFLPEGIWKLLRLLEIGKEKPLRKAKEVLDRFAAKYVPVKCDEFGMGNAREYSILSMYLTGDDDKSQWKVDDEALQGSLISLMVTGKDTTSVALT